MTIGFDLFEEREQPPMSAEMFTTLVVARLRSSGVAVDGQRRLEVEFRTGRGQTVASLDSQYRRYRAQPSALTPLIQEFVEGLKEGLSESAPANATESGPTNLMPLLVGVNEWRQKREAGMQTVTRPLVGDVGVALVIDEPGAITFFEYERLGSWHLDIASAFEAAERNLERRARDICCSQTGEGESILLVDRVSDGYAATRAILPSRLEGWSGRVPGELVLGIPRRDFLIGMSGHHPNLEALAKQVKKDATADEHGLSKDLLVYRGGRLEVYS